MHRSHLLLLLAACGPGTAPTQHASLAVEVVPPPIDLAVTPMVKGETTTLTVEGSRPASGCSSG